MCINKHHTLSSLVSNISLTTFKLNMRKYMIIIEIIKNNSRFHNLINKKKEEKVEKGKASSTC